MSEPENIDSKGKNWAALAFTKQQWDLLNAALLKEQSLLKEIFGAENFYYVYRWTKAVGSKP